MRKNCYSRLFTAILIFTGLFCLQAQNAAAQNENPLIEKLFQTAEKNAEDGKFEAAIADYGKILEISQNEADAFYGRGYVYLQIADYDKAIDDFTKTLELKPEDFYTFFMRGKAYYKKGDYESSIADHTSELELEAGRSSGQIERGNAFLKLGQFDEAMADYNRAIIFSGMPGAYLARGAAFLQKGDNTAAAAADLKYYLDSVPDDPKAREMLGQLGAKQNELPKPILTADPKIPAAAMKFFNSAIERIGQNEYTEAVFDLSQAIKIYPQFAAAYFYRGYAYEIPGSLINYRKINADYTKAIALNPKFVEAYIRRGYNEFYNTLSAKALLDLKKAAALDPKSAKAFLYQGLFNQNSDAKRLLGYNQALKLNPNYAEAYLQRADFYEEKSQNDKAIADFTAVTKINANDYRAFDGRAKIYCKQGKKQLAAEDEKKVIALGGEVGSPCNEK